MMSCETVKDSLDALRDGTLGEQEARELRHHLAGCRSCRTEWEVTERLREVIRDRASAPDAPAAFREAMTRLLKPEPAPVSLMARLQQAIRLRPLAAMAVAVAVAILVVLPLNLRLLSSRGAMDVITPLVEESVNEHIRLTLREALPDIPSRELQPLHDRHQRRLEFSGPLSFPDDAEFQLVGGQVSYLLRRNVLAVTYRKADRPITLLVLPGSGIRMPEQPTAPAGRVYRATDRGFQTVHWQQGPLIYSLVSDLGHAEMSRLAERLQQK